MTPYEVIIGDRLIISPVLSLFTGVASTNGITRLIWHNGALHADSLCLLGFHLLPCLGCSKVRGVPLDSYPNPWARSEDLWAGLGGSLTHLSLSWCPCPSPQIISASLASARAIRHQCINGKVLPMELTSLMPTDGQVGPLADVTYAAAAPAKSSRSPDM